MLGREAVGRLTVGSGRSEPPEGKITKLSHVMKIDEDLCKSKKIIKIYEHLYKSMKIQPMPQIHEIQLKIDEHL